MKIDLLNPVTFAQGHPHDMYRWLRDTAPVYWHDEPDGPGFWVVSRYSEVDATGRDPGLYSSEPTIMIADPDSSTGLAVGDRQMMLMMDPPRHTAFRKLISREFTKGPALQLKPRIAELARHILDRVIDRGTCEFVSEVAGELPSYVIAELMGIPREDGRELYKLTETLHSAPEALPEGAQMEALMQMFAYAQGVYRDKHQHPANDLASQIVAAQLDGAGLDEVDFQLFFMLLVDAGGDTTRNLVAGGMHALIERPTELNDLSQRPEQIPLARDELLRWVSPVTYMRRTVTRDTDLAGTQLRRGDKLVRYFGAANFDERHFTNPQTLDLTRDARTHLAFGSGTHICLGQHIARIEIDCMLTEVVTRLRDVQCEEPPVWLASNFISGIKHMPIRFQPA